MGRLAASKLQREKEEKNPPKRTEPPKYEGFAKTGLSEENWRESQPEEDTRSGLQKAYDTVNVGDSGRSWSTKNPKKNKSVKDSVGDIGIGIFSGTEKTVDAVEALTGVAAKQDAKRDKDFSEANRIINEQLEKDPDNQKLKDAKKELKEKYQSDLDESIKDTAWAGSEDKGTGDRLKKSAGVAAQTVSEWLPASKGVQAGMASRKAAVQSGETVSRLAKAKLAANTGAEQSLVGALGSVGGDLSDDSVDLTDREDQRQVATNALSGLALGGAMGAAGTFAPEAGAAIKKLIPGDEKGFIKNPFFHSTTADKVDSILADEKLVASRPLDGVGGESGNPVPVDPNNFDTNPGVYMDTQSGKDWYRPDQENVEFAYKGNIVKEFGGDIKKSGTQAAIANDVPVTKDTVAAVRVGTEETAQKFRDKGFENVTVDESLDLRPKEKKNVVMAAEVEPPTTESLVAEVPRRDAAAQVEGEPKLQLKVLDDVQREADVRSPGDSTVPAAQKTETKTQKGAQYLVDDIDRLQQESGIDLDPLDRQVAEKLTGETRRKPFQEFRDKMGRNFQDTLTYGTRTLGKTGADFVYDMLQGNKFKRDALDALRTNMSTIGKLNKKLAGKSTTAKRDLGARLGAALDDRANADNFLKTPQERELFDQYVSVFDYVKDLREKSGLETLENYRPWVSMKEAAEPPTWLAENVTTKRTQTLSRFSKERTKTSAGDDVDNNLADMIYGYVNSQLNEMAYDAPVKKFKGGIDNLSAGNKANVGSMNEGIDYMRELVQQAVNPARKNPLERGVNQLASNVYGSVLPLNIRLALQNKAQQFVANSRVSKGARKLAKKIGDTDLQELEKGLVFGDTTVYGQLEDINPAVTGKGKSIAQKVAKVDPYQKSEHTNVMTSYRKGAAQAIMESDAYKAAKKSGKSSEEAISIALQDPATKQNAIRRGNVVVNDTQFGASPLARPEMLREEGNIWGVLPKKAVYMFTRFPIGMSQHTLEVLDGSGTRALEMLKNGDPRAVPISEMRTNFRALLSSMEDAKLALKDGTDIGIPEEVLNKQISTVRKNLGVIDSEAKKLSQIRGGKTVKNLGKMWASAAAIQLIFDGGIQSFQEDPVGETVDALAKTNPTASNKVVGSYSPLAAITSSVSPLDRYGNINERAVANYVPGVGLAVNRGRDIKKLYESLTGSGEEE